MIILKVYKYHIKNNNNYIKISLPASITHV